MSSIQNLMSVRNLVRSFWDRKAPLPRAELPKGEGQHFDRTCKFTELN